MFGPEVLRIREGSLECLPAGSAVDLRGVLGTFSRPPAYLGLGFCASSGLFLFCVYYFCFFLASVFQTDGIVKLVFSADIWCAISCADFWCADFCVHFLHRFLVRRCLRPCLHRFSAVASSPFLRLQNRCSRVAQKCAENPRNSRGVRMALLGGGHPIPSLLSRADSTSHNCRWPDTQGEHVSVRSDIFGPKGMLALAPRVSKTKICEI